MPKHVYETLDEEEQKLWHSHVYEVKSGMLILPTPESHKGHAKEWEKLETEALRDLAGWYGKLYHFWQVDRGDELPLGPPKLMGSLTQREQLDIDEVLKEKNQRFDVDHRRKAEVRRDIAAVDVHGNADCWWNEARRDKKGCYAES